MRVTIVSKTEFLSWPLEILISKPKPGHRCLRSRTQAHAGDPNTIRCSAAPMSSHAECPGGPTAASTNCCLELQAPVQLKAACSARTAYCKPWIRGDQRDAAQRPRWSACDPPRREAPRRRHPRDADGRQTSLHSPPASRPGACWTMVGAPFTRKPPSRLSPDCLPASLTRGSGCCRHPPACRQP